MQPLNQAEAITVLNAILVGYEHLECLDRIQNTTLYKHSLKMKLNAVQKELEKHLHIIGDISDIDHEAMYNIMEHKKQLIKKICVLQPENQSGLNHIMDMFFENPELLIHRLGIKIIDRDK